MTRLNKQAVRKVQTRCTGFQFYRSDKMADLAVIHIRGNCHLLGSLREIQDHTCVSGIDKECTNRAIIGK